MTSRYITFRCIGLYQKELSLWKHKPPLFSRSLTTNSQSYLNISNRRASIQRYALLLGLPISTAIYYRLSTTADARRKHLIILESIVRAAR